MLDLASDDSSSDEKVNDAPMAEDAQARKGKTPAKSKKPKPPETQLPHRLSSLTRSIVEFAKFMMGTTGRDNYHLPDPPTSEELKQYEAWGIDYVQAVDAFHQEQASRNDIEDEAEREHLKKKELKELELSLQSTRYEPAPIPPNYEISKHFKDQCDQSFRLKGFPRITFQWNKPSLEGSSWNYATADILANQWHSWYIKDRRYSPSTKLTVDAKGVIGRWLKTAAMNQAQKPKEESSENSTRTTQEMNTLRRHREQRRIQIARHRHASAMRSVPKQHKEYLSELLSANDMSSDYEDDEDPEVPPTRILPFWRSKALTDLLHELDVATIQLASSEKKPNLIKLLQRKETREATELEVLQEKVPTNVCLQGFNKYFLQDTSILERRQLQIDETPKSYSLTQALVDLQKLTCKSNAVPID
ncbi:hypothetical protein PGTUg99_015283 [Puccinia graminis f. sp. tritici]|uniref:Uncharacterized protein n=1 Tax=Puccinia graminis f. sp. tritici TaxID=56615 RepID=A0A5B0M6N0_PUCGR|nr:hypothetical protein PGTUg99_015283 [Puccinia graminis f. sp. tritici]